MPVRPKLPCRYPGCPELVAPGSGGLCKKHKAQRQKEQDSKRASAYKRGYDRTWGKARKMYLARNPLCAECQRRKKKRIEAATEVDHIIPHKGNMVLFWDENNWQGLCKQCHSEKTAKEDGGFGRTVKDTKSSDKKAKK